MKFSCSLKSIIKLCSIIHVANMILPNLVYKFASLPPISAHFLPHSNSGWSFSCRSQKGLAATILKRKSHSLVLQYKCKYGHLRTAGLWIMEAGFPWYSWEGEHSGTQKTEREKVHNPWLYFYFLSCLFAHTAVRCRSGVRQQQQHWRMLQAFGWIRLSLLSPFPSEMHLKCRWSGVCCCLWQ